MKLYFSLLLFITTFLSFSQSEDYTDTVFTNGIEGPAFWKNELYVVNYKKQGTIGITKPNGTTYTHITLPKGSIANGIVFNKKGGMFMADYSGHNILYYGGKKLKTEIYFHSDKFNQPNDICKDSKNGFYLSDPNWTKSTGNLWYVNSNKNLIVVDSSMGTTNGIALSPDGKYLYVNESVQGMVWKYTLAKNGAAISRQLFHHFTDFGMDGMKTDDKGNLYISRYGAGNITILNPEGQLLKTVSLNGQFPTNIAFNDNDYSVAYVTMQKRKCVEKVLIKL